ncbi:MAG TPA: LysM peptidoglycan-binding domain-containing protein [Parachlamydiaceae bacterium]|nr:LysM peptidoglycan-binding domain-containing protein [Parachlamydiaceae bacterium]
MVIHPLVFLSIFITPVDVTAAPRGQYYQDPNAAAIREMRDSIEDVRHGVSNHEVEIRIIDEKMKSFDSIIDSVRDQLSDSSRIHKEQLKGSSASLESRIISLEDTSKGLLTDLRLFKAHSNETTAALTQYKQKIGDLEKIIDQQNDNIEHLQAAMRSLMEALNGKPSGQDKHVSTAASCSVASPSRTPSSSDRSYKIKAGDSLEKIARAHQTTIQSIKEANGLTTDRIVVGRTLFIPEK